MKQYSIKTTAATCCLLFSSLFSMAQAEQGCPVVCQELSKQGDSVIVRMEMDLNGQRPMPRKSYDVKPVLTNGAQQLQLPAVSVKGRRSYRDYKRSLAFMTKNERAVWQQPYAVLRKGEAGRVDYRYSVAYEPWMKDAWLDVTSETCACGTMAQSVTKRASEHIKLEDLFLANPSLAYRQPAAEQVKQRERQGESYLDFVVGKTDIRPDFRNNPRELERIRQMVGDVYNDQDITIRRIEITGYASPEGTLAHNKVLSENRAKSLCKYIQDCYSIPADRFGVNFGGENWDGLTELVKASSMKEKEQVLAIINNTAIADGRETKLMELAGGAPYNYMLTNMFPSLRKAECRIEYNVRNYDVEETRKLISTKPQNLSLSEMFLLANSYQAGSDEFNEVMGIAVRMYPEDETANLNAANAALQVGDIKSAEKYLQKAGNGAEVLNARGVILALQKKNDEALQLFRQASEAGCAQAAENIKQLTY